MTEEELNQSLKSYIETDFWPRHRGLDEAVLLMLREPHGSWEQFDLYLSGAGEGFRRNQILTSAMRQAVSTESPYAVSVIAEVRHYTTDPHAHYDHVAASLETRDSQTDESPVLLWKLGLDDASIEFVSVGRIRPITLGNLYRGSEDTVNYWVYARKPSGGLGLISKGGSFRSKPMSVEEIKRMTYRAACKWAGAKLNKQKVMKSLIVSFRPLETESDEETHR